MSECANEDVDNCFFCGKRLSISEFNKTVRIEMKDDNNNILYSTNRPVCSCCEKMLEEYWKRDE